VTKIILLFSLALNKTCAAFEISFATMLHVIVRHIPLCGIFYICLNIMYAIISSSGWWWLNYITLESGLLQKKMLVI
jgi:hypothetical protein